MAPPKTYQNYDSFDAYVDSILLKRNSKEGMFAVWNQECADTVSGSAEDFSQCRDLARAELNKLRPAELRSLQELAKSGHGGKMLERFSAMTQINAQNWRDKAREQQEPRIEQEPQLLRI